VAVKEHTIGVTGEEIVMSERPIQTVRIKIAYRSNRFYVSSDDVPGLWLWGSDFGELLKDVGPTIQDLYKFNHGIDVEVKEDLASKFLNWILIHLFRVGRDKYKIYSIGSRQLTRAHG